jgi:hypothetical protein
MSDSIRTIGGARTGNRRRPASSSPVNAIAAACAGHRVGPKMAGCSATHLRDDNPAINFARYADTVSVVAPVGAAVKRERPGLTGLVGVKRGKRRRPRGCRTTRDGCEWRDH